MDGGDIALGKREKLEFPGERIWRDRHRRCRFIRSHARTQMYFLSWICNCISFTLNNIINISSDWTILKSRGPAKAACVGRRNFKWEKWRNFELYRSGNIAQMYTTHLLPRWQEGGFKCRGILGLVIKRWIRKESPLGPWVPGAALSWTAEPFSRISEEDSVPPAKRAAWGV